MKHTVKGSGFNSTTGGFTHLYIDEKAYSADQVAAAVNNHEGLLKAIQPLIAFLESELEGDEDHPFHKQLAAARAAAAKAEAGHD